jgi:hypothetical protein
MRALILDEKTRAAIGRVVEYARAHPYELEQIHQIRDGTLPPPGDNPEHCCLIPVGFRAAYTLENHPGGLHRHLSVSVDGGPGKMPSVAAVQELMKEFGFKNDLSACYVYTEGVPGGSDAANVL